MVGKNRKAEDPKHPKTRRDEQKITKKVLAQQAATKNSQKQAGSGKGTSTKNRGGPPSNTPRKTPHCVLCRSNHWTKNHRFDLHGNFSHQNILDTLRSNKLCFRCILPLSETHKFQQCSNPISQCEHCSSFSHMSLVCKQRKNNVLDMPRAPFDPKNKAPRQPEVVTID